MPLELASPVIIIASACVLIVLERMFPYDRNQTLFRSGFFNDLAFYALIQSYVLGYVIFYMVRWIDRQTGISRLHLVSEWPIIWQIVFFLILHDLYIYLFHRWQHSSRYLWRIHEAHHSTREVDWLSGARSHSLEILVNQSVEYAPLVLCGAAPVVILAKGMIDSIWGMYIHSNIDVHSGKLQLLLNGPEMHRWHHAIEITEGGINFATKLAIWDWIFGTAYLPRPKKPSGYGLKGVDFPKNYFSQHVYAFRKFDSPESNQAEDSGTMTSRHVAAEP